MPNPNCTLVVPADPTGATGLATPFRLRATDADQGPCHEADKAQSAFVEAAVLDPRTGALSIYHPLVVDDGDEPAVAPTAPALPTGAVVGVWFGFNGDVLTLDGAGAGECVNGVPGSPFGQFAHCHAPAFFTAATAAVDAGTLRIPALGAAADGRPCPTVRDFSVVDQDQSDNLATTYRIVGGRMAQDTAAAAGGQKLSNASDNGLLTAFIDPALGCRPFTAPDLGGGRPTSALALNELQAHAHQGDPVALVPANDPMSKVDDALSPTKNALYRAGVDQPTTASADPAAYCRALVDVAPARLAADRERFGAAPSPDPAATTLFTFLAQRLQGSYTMLGCGDLGVARPPITVTMDGDRAVAASIDR